MVLQADSLEGQQSLQVNFVDSRVRLVEDEAKPGRESKEVREQEATVGGRRSVICFK